MHGHTTLKTLMTGVGLEHTNVLPPHNPFSWRCYSVESCDEWSCPWTHRHFTSLSLSAPCMVTRRSNLLWPKLSLDTKRLTSTSSVPCMVIQRWKLWWMELFLNTLKSYLDVIRSVYGDTTLKAAMTGVVLEHTKVLPRRHPFRVWWYNVESCDEWSCP